jgi:hypothetical protein
MEKIKGLKLQKPFVEKELTKDKEGSHSVIELNNISLNFSSEVATINYRVYDSKEFTEGEYKDMAIEGTYTPEGLEGIVQVRYEDIDFENNIMEESIRLIEEFVN